MSIQEHLADLEEAIEIEDIYSNPTIKFCKDLACNVIPLLSLGDSAAEKIIKDNMERKLNILLTEIATGSENIVIDEMSSIDAIMSFHLLLNAITRMERNEKIRVSAKLFKNSLFVSNTPMFSWDEYEEWLNALTSLSYREYYVLALLRSFEIEYNNMLFDIDVTNKYWNDFEEAILPRYGMHIHELYAILKHSESVGFYCFDRTTLESQNEAFYIKGYTTEYFQKFIQRINMEAD